MEKISPAATNVENVSKHQNKKSKGTIKAVLAGTLAQSASLPVSLGIIKGVECAQKGLNKDQVDIVNTAADNIIDSVANLGKKGVKIQNHNMSLNFTMLPDKLFEMFNPNAQIANGKNAGFINKDQCGGIIKKNTILVNREKPPMLTFHELGHAFNFNNSAFWKSMQKTRTPGMVLATIFAMLPALTKEEKPEEGQELTKGQKAKNTLRKASPFLAFASMLPMLGEEAMASIRGCSWAKQLLDKNLYKKVLKTNAIAYTSYIVAALSFSAMAIVGKIVKDKSQKKQEEQSLKNNTQHV